MLYKIEIKLLDYVMISFFRNILYIVNGIKSFSIFRINICI